LLGVDAEAQLLDEIPNSWQIGFGMSCAISWNARWSEKPERSAFVSVMRASTS